MGKSRTPNLKALSEPFEAVLGRFGFRQQRLEDKGSLFVACEWVTDAVLVSASVEPREQWGSLMLARHLAPDYWGSLPGPAGEPMPWHEQPYWTRIHTSEILLARGVEPRISPAQSCQVGTADQIRHWAELGAADLEVLADLLGGENLNLLDDLIERRPRRGVPGLDFPWPSYTRPGSLMEE